MWRFFLLVLILLQSLVYFTFLKYLKSTRIYKPSLSWKVLIPFILFNVPFILISLIYGRGFNPPEWFRIIGYYPFYVWQAATFFIAMWLLAGKLLKLPFKITILIARLISPLKDKINCFGENKYVKKVDYSRRRFVRLATGVVSTYAFGGAVYGIIKHDKYEIDYIDIPISNLPDELKGLTITLISDIHSGQYMDEKDMREYADVINSLESDIICIPGDFVNFEVKDVHPLTRAFRDLKARYGIYGALGNHDFFQDATYITKAILNESPVQVLRNEHRKITIGGKDLYVIGVDDTISSGSRMQEVLMYYGAMEEYLVKNELTFSNSPKILLCHKPYGFDILAARNIDLVLSGHRHGGQVVPIKFGEFNLSFAATVSRYIEGHYRLGNSNMYVSRGIGSVGLPVRINCPPEITKITLV